MGLRAAGGKKNLTLLHLYTKLSEAFSHSNILKYCLRHQREQHQDGAGGNPRPAQLSGLPALRKEPLSNEAQTQQQS